MDARDSLRKAFHGIEDAKAACAKAGDNDPKFQIVSFFKSIPAEEHESFMAKTVMDLIDSGTEIFSCTAHAVKIAYGDDIVYMAVLHEYLKWALLETESLKDAQAAADDFAEFMKKETGADYEHTVWVSPEVN